jgi:hypothetical protein
MKGNDVKRRRKYSNLFLPKKIPIFWFHAQSQGCQMVYFQTKNPDLGKFWRALELKS